MQKAEIKCITEINVILLLFAKLLMHRLNCSTLVHINILIVTRQTRSSKKSGRTKSSSDWVSGITNQSATELYASVFIVHHS